MGGLNIRGLKDEELINKILGDEGFYPCLLMGSYVTLFKKIYGDIIFSVHSLEDVRGLVDRFYGLEDLGGKIFVLDGVGFLSVTGQNSLLKFIEESKFKIVLLSYYDKVSPIIKSRMKFVFKKPVSSIKNLKFGKLRDVLTLVDDSRKKDSEFNDMDEVKIYADNCPGAFIFKYSIERNDYDSERILRMLSRV